MFFHGSKHLECWPGAKPRPTGTRATHAQALSGLAAEALPGQVLRGGRSSPPEIKPGDAAAKGGYETDTDARGAATAGRLPRTAVTEQ